jgi:hypothetical protein
MTAKSAAGTPPGLIKQLLTPSQEGLGSVGMPLCPVSLLSPKNLIRRVPPCDRVVPGLSGLQSVRYGLDGSQKKVRSRVFGSKVISKSTSVATIPVALIKSFSTEWDPPKTVYWELGSGKKRPVEPPPPPSLPLGSTVSASAAADDSPRRIRIRQQRKLFTGAPPHTSKQHVTRAI